MAPFNPIIASLNFTHASHFSDEVCQFILDRNLILATIRDHWTAFITWLLQTHVLAVITSWAVTFAIIIALLLCLGFGPIGVVAGSFAAVFQAWMYGGFTPAGGIFATLTSLGMLGLLNPLARVIAAVVAMVVALIVWACGVGT